MKGRIHRTETTLSLIWTNRSSHHQRKVVPQNNTTRDQTEQYQPTTQQLHSTSQTLHHTTLTANNARNHWKYNQSTAGTDTGEPKHLHHLACRSKQKPLEKRSNPQTTSKATGTTDGDGTPEQPKSNSNRNKLCLKQQQTTLNQARTQRSGQVKPIVAGAPKPIDLETEEKTKKTMAGQKRCGAEWRSRRTTVYGGYIMPVGILDMGGGGWWWWF
ncbi:hypothetical protein A2U01_0023761, partial [Trifolium medium]|nr:hypothetical protein [Trifolium medium]